MERWFLGIELPPSVKQALGQLQSECQSSPWNVQAGNWQGQDLFHLTVVFLGELDEAAASQLDAVGRGAVSAVSPFGLSLDAPGVFARNKVLWVGIDAKGNWDEMDKLYRSTRLEVMQRKIAKVEDRPFRPHITLARKLVVSSSTKLQEQSVDWQKSLRDIHFEVSALSLFESTRIQGRLVYPVRARFPFGEGLEKP